MIYLHDLDVLYYAFVSRSMVLHEVSKGMYTSVFSQEKLADIVEEYIANIEERNGKGKHHFFASNPELSSRDYFRSKLDVTYKENRNKEPSEQRLYITKVRELFTQLTGYKVVHNRFGLETDDMLRIAYTKLRDSGNNETFVVSNDKDFKPFCDTINPFDYQRYAKDEFILLKLLVVGDKADNVTGLEKDDENKKGYGEAWFKALVERHNGDYVACKREVMEHYRRQGKDFSFFLDMLAPIGANQYTTVDEDKYFLVLRKGTLNIDTKARTMKFSTSKAEPKDE